MSEAIQMRISAMVAAALMAGTASAGVECEGPKFQLVEQGGKALYTSLDETIVGTCRAFTTPYPELAPIANTQVCSFTYGPSDWVMIEVLVLEPNRVISITVDSSQPADEPAGIHLEGTCTGFDEE